MTAYSNNHGIHMEEISIKKGTRIAPSPALEQSTGSHLPQQEKEAPMPLGERIKQSKSILTLKNLATPSEIEALVESCLAAANDQKKSNGSTFDLLDDGVPGNAYVRMSTVEATQRENRPETDALPEDVSEKLEGILRKVFDFVDQELCSSVKASLLGIQMSPDDATEPTAPTSLVEMFETRQLQFSIREPAINIYTAPHGHFGMHKDNNDLTILMPLSSPDDFEGGGTAFWSQSYPVEGMHDPSLIMRPEAGTAMLFGGKVSHKGMHIKSGTRVVFVASFSRPSYGTERDRSSSWRLD